MSMTRPHKKWKKLIIIGLTIFLLFTLNGQLLDQFQHEQQEERNYEKNQVTSSLSSMSVTPKELLSISTRTTNIINTTRMNNSTPTTTTTTMDDSSTTTTFKHSLSSSSQQEKEKEQLYHHYHPHGQPKYTILPKRIYTVIGLESSGTQFVSSIIQNAFKLPAYREGSFPFDSRKFRMEQQDIQVQHFSLPWGEGDITQQQQQDDDDDKKKKKEKNVWLRKTKQQQQQQQTTASPIVDVVLPSQCTRLGRNTDSKMIPTRIIRQECTSMAKEIWGTSNDGMTTTTPSQDPSSWTSTSSSNSNVTTSQQKDQEEWQLTLPVHYPSRYNLDIISHKEWYDKWGVEQYFIIVIRDEQISFLARQGHCPNELLRIKEERVGTDIITDAIHKYILNNSPSSSNYKRKVTKENNHRYQFWNMTGNIVYSRIIRPSLASKSDTIKTRQEEDSNTSNSSDAINGSGHKPPFRLSTSFLPSGNNVVLVSYESMMKLGQTYIELLYQTLGIQSDYVPDIENGNNKYIDKSIRGKPVGRSQYHQKPRSTRFTEGGRREGRRQKKKMKDF